MEISTLRKTILRNLERLEQKSYRGRVNTFKLWMEFTFSRKKGEDFGLLYRKHQSVLELLIVDGEVENVDKKYLGDTDVQLTSKGRNELDVINRNYIKKLLLYFEPQIKSEIFKLIILGISVVIAYAAGYYRVFIGR